MKYGTWNILFNNDSSLGGTTPIEIEGAFFCNNSETQIAGYIPDNININTLSDWSVTEITQQQFIDLMLASNSQGTLVNGKATFPSLLKLGNNGNN
jgi:hypothetical protein